MFFGHPFGSCRELLLAINGQTGMSSLTFCSPELGTLENDCAHRIVRRERDKYDSGERGSRSYFHPNCFFANFAKIGPF